MNKELGQILKKIRKSTKLSQERVGALLDMDQTAISRIENGEQPVSVESLIKLSRFYELDIDYIINGQINYWALAKKFGQTPALKARYKDMNGGFVRELLPLIKLLVSKKGEKWTNKALESFDLESVRFLSPNEEISKNCFLDLLKFSLSKKAISKKDIQTWASFYNNGEILGDILPALSAGKDPLQISMGLSNSSDLFDSIFENNVLEMKKDSVIIGLQKKEHLTKKILTENDLGPFLMDLKKYQLMSLSESLTGKKAKIELIEDFSHTYRNEAKLLVQVA